MEMARKLVLLCAQNYILSGYKDYFTMVGPFFLISALYFLKWQLRKRLAG
jgi:hypothetical protein